MSNPRRKARWRRQRAASVATPVPPARWPLAAYKPLPSVWVPDVANAHLLDAARGLSTIALPLHPPGPVCITLPRRHGRSWAARC